MNEEELIKTIEELLAPLRAKNMELIEEMLGTIEKAFLKGMEVGKALTKPSGKDN